MIPLPQTLTLSAIRSGLPYLIIGILTAALAAMTNLYLGKRDQLAALSASVQALGQAAEKAVEYKKIEYAANLQTVKDDHEKLIPYVRAGAVRNYLLAHPSRVRVDPRCSTVPGTATREQVDDGAVQEPVPDDTTIRNCAEDASKTAAFQQYCQLNRCPVKD